MDSTLQAIITAATFAPSGENCQPWRFVVEGNRIEVHMIAERDQSAYSWGQRASYVAIGAAVENMVIAASEKGKKTTVVFGPQGDGPVAIVTVQDDGSVMPDPLVDAVQKRCTNRKPYKKTPLSAEIQSSLKLVPTVSPAHFHLITDRSAIQRLATGASANERILFENRSLHDFFFGHINWTKEEDDQKSIGFYIKTLELPPPAVIGFELCREWKMQLFMNKLGISKIVSAINKKIYSSAAGIGSISIPDDTPESFFAAGRSLERVWLLATHLGLSVQPLSGLLFLFLQIKSGNTSIFSSHHSALIQQSYQQIQRTFETDRTIAMMFRLGYSSAPSARASRLAPLISEHTL